MSRLSNVGAQSPQEKVVAQVETLLSTHGTEYASAATAKNVFSMESLNDVDFSNTKAIYDDIKQSLANGELGEELNGLDPHRRELSLEAAAMTIMAAGDTRGLFSALSKKPKSEGVSLINANVGNMDFMSADDNFSLEGYDPASANQFIAHSVYANAMGVLQGDFEETFFPTQIVAAGQDGVDVPVVIPKVYNTIARGPNGACKDFGKQSIIDALIDSSILDRNTTKIIPNADGGGAATFLVANADVPTTSLNVDGVTVNTRPLLFGKEVDLISISEVAALLQGGSLNETDALDSVMNIGTVWMRIGADDGGVVSTVVGVDVSGAKGAVFTQTAEGSNRQYQANLNVEVEIPRTIANVSGGTMDAVATNMEANLTVTAGSEFKTYYNISISATANTETACMRAFANSITLSRVVDVNGAEQSITALAPAVDPNLALLGFTPAARRTNRNLRSAGIIVDSTGTVTYRFPVPLGTPIISQKPVGTDINTSLEGLAHVQRVRNNNQATKALLAMATLLGSNAGVPANNPAVGSELVTPTFVADTVDIANVVVSLSSSQALNDIRVALLTSIQNVANQLVCQSGYLAALEFLSGANKDYEVIVVTDCNIYPWLMETGDERTFGYNRQFKITQSLNKDLKDKIYISLRRKERDGKMHPLDFGAHLYKPTIVAKLAVPRAGAVSDEIHTIPANAHYVTLPVLGEISVTGLVDYYLQ